uniref:Uncharacterized protein n=1 Tax=Panagrolaimus superbus TaxID=310955 RepID=A0A914YKM8_9BILA
MNSGKYILNSYPLQLQLNFVNLYKVEIVNRFDQNANLWKEFACIVGDTTIEEYSARHIDAETFEEKHNISELLFNTMIKSQLKHFVYTQIMDFLEMGKIYFR